MFRFTLLLVLGALLIAHAQDPAQVSALKGEVSLRHGGSGSWIKVTTATPLVAGDQIATAARASAFIQLDSDNSVTVAATSEAQMAGSPEGIVPTLVKGSLNWHVPRDPATPREIRMPNVAARASLPGQYQLSVNGLRQSEITAWSGSIEVVSPFGTEWVPANRKMTVRGDAAAPEFKIGNAISLWRRIAPILANSLQIVADASSAWSSGGGSTPAKGNSFSGRGPAPAAPAASHSAAPVARPADGGRGK